MRIKFPKKSFQEEKETHHEKSSRNKTVNSGNEAQRLRGRLLTILAIIFLFAFLGFIKSKYEEIVSGINKTAAQEKNISCNPDRITLEEFRKIEGCENISAEVAEEEISNAYQWAKLIIYSFNKIN